MYVMRAYAYTFCSQVTKNCTVFYFQAKGLEAGVLPYIQLTLAFINRLPGEGEQSEQTPPD